MWTACPSRGSAPSSVSADGGRSNGCVVRLSPMQVRLRGGNSEGRVADATHDISDTQDGTEAIDADEDDAQYWAEHPKGLAAAKELPPSYQRAINQALAENTTLFPGAPYSTRASLEAAAWEFLKRSRDTSLGDEVTDAVAHDADLFNFDNLYGMHICMSVCLFAVLCLV